MSLRISVSVLGPRPPTVHVSSIIQRLDGKDGFHGVTTIVICGRASMW